MPDPQVDLAPGRLTGYRRWKVVGTGAEDDPFRMISITAKTAWPWTPEIRATCQRRQIGENYPRFADPVEHDPEDVPNAECSCGVYACYEFVAPFFGQMAGAIEAWGPTVVGDHAFRARHARLIGLFHDYSPSQLAQLGELYRVPTFTSEMKFRQEFPASNVSSLLPPRPEPEFDHFAAAGPITGSALAALTARQWAGGSGGYAANFAVQSLATEQAERERLRQEEVLRRRMLPRQEPRVATCHCGQRDCPMNTMTQAPELHSRLPRSPYF